MKEIFFLQIALQSDAPNYTESESWMGSDTGNGVPKILQTIKNGSEEEDGNGKRWPERKLTDEPGIASVVDGRESEKVIVESFDRMRLRQKGQSAFDLRLVAFGDEQTAGPTVGADKVEVARQVVAPDGPHHSRHFLVAAEDDDAFSLWLRVDFEDDAVVCGVAGHARILHQTLPHRDADVVLGQQLLQLFERLPHYNRVNICPSPIRVGRRRPSSSAN